MLTLLTIPDDLFSNALKYLTAVDLWRLGAVCRKFHEKDPERNVVQNEVKVRDEMLILTQQYPPRSPIMCIFDVRQRVLVFERCSAFAWEMTHHAQQHETRGFTCKETRCKYFDLQASIPRLANGLRMGKYFLFFAQFTCNDKLFWQGFLKDYNPQSDLTSPMDGLLVEPDRLPNEIANAWRDFQQRKVEGSDVQIHLDTGNVTNFTKEDVSCDLHTTLVSLIYYRDQPGSLPEVRLHYSSSGFQSQYPQMSSLNHNLPSIDILRDQYVTMHQGRHADHATPFLIWKSSRCP